MLSLCFILLIHKVVLAEIKSIALLIIRILFLLLMNHTHLAWIYRLMISLRIHTWLVNLIWILTWAMQSLRSSLRIRLFFLHLIQISTSFILHSSRIVIFLVIQFLIFIFFFEQRFIHEMLTSQERFELLLQKSIEFKLNYNKYFFSSRIVLIWFTPSSQFCSTYEYSSLKALYFFLSLLYFLFN